MKLKFHWGYGILVFIIVFLLFIAGNIFYSTFIRTDLVERDYYESELKYQEQIDKMQRTKDSGVIPEFIQGAATLAVKFPDDYKDKEVSGQFYFYRPSDASLDRVIEMDLNENSFQTIQTKGIPKGFWRVKIDWNVDSVSYFHEEEIYIKE